MGTPSRCWSRYVGEIVEDSLGRRYTLSDVAGAGGHAVVFRGESDGGRPVALKFRQPGSSVPVSSFLREIDILTGNGRHRHVLAGHGRTRPHPTLSSGLVLEWAPRNLEQLVGQISWQDFRPMLEGLLDALRYLHGRGIVHRDIDPTNIVFSEAEPHTPKLADFGIAHVAGDSSITADSKTFVKPGYTHPLAATEQPRAEFDLYSLGISAFRVLAGEFPAGASWTARRTRLQGQYRCRHGDDLPTEALDCVMGLINTELQSAGEALAVLHCDAGQTTQIASPGGGDAELVEDVCPLLGWTNTSDMINRFLRSDAEQMTASAGSSTPATPARSRSHRRRRGLMATASLTLASVITLFCLHERRLAPTDAGSRQFAFHGQAAPDTNLPPRCDAALANKREQHLLGDDRVLVLTRGESELATIRQVALLRTKGHQQVLEAEVGRDTIIDIERLATATRFRFRGTFPTLTIWHPEVGLLNGEQINVNLDVLAPTDPATGSPNLAGKLRGHFRVQQWASPAASHTGPTRVSFDACVQLEPYAPVRLTLTGVEVRVPQDVLAESLRRAIPDAQPLEEQLLAGKLLVYRDVKASGMRLSGLTPETISFPAGSTMAFTLHPRVTGAINKLYQHVVVKPEVKTIAVVDAPLGIGRKEIKQLVPTAQTDWRPDQPCPFQVGTTLRGTCKVTLEGGDDLVSKRVVLSLKAQPIEIDDVRLEGVPVVSQVVPLLRTKVSGLRLPTQLVDRQISIPLLAGADCRLQRRLQKLDLRFAPDGKDLVFLGACDLAFEGG